jgi:hypothetical protein
VTTTKSGRRTLGELPERPARDVLTIDELRERAVVGVPTGGAVLGLSRSASYRAAERGEIPTIRLGRRLVVPVPRLLAMLEGEAATDAA